MLVGVFLVNDMTRRLLRCVQAVASGDADLTVAEDEQRQLRARIDGLLSLSGSVSSRRSLPQCSSRCEAVTSWAWLLKA
jgi:hypothetical protein